jgi:carboxypeptidase Taq
VTALTALRERLGELSDLVELERLASWDQRTMMPPGGGEARARQLATLERLSHDRGSDDALGAWLDELEAAPEALGDVDRDLVRIARRDWDRRRRVPAELAAELALAGSAGQERWQLARERDDFSAYAPVLERNVELARAYAACFDDEHPYDSLLADYDFGLTSARVHAVFARLAEALPPLVADAATRPAPPVPSFTVGVQEAAVEQVLRQVGVDDSSWRVDVSVHPFSTCIGPLDSRLTTRYEDGYPMAILAALHEFGHALYERQIGAELVRTSLGGGTSMSIHESQSKLWENHVGRNPAFAPVIAAALGGVDAERLHAAFVHVQPGLIRVSADPTTYPLHIVLRFELELALIDGTLAVSDLPAAWNDGMRRLLGVEVPNDTAGVMQDLHWAAGAFGYFPSYALGCLIAAQLWEQLEADAGPQDEALGRGDTAGVREWLREHVHRHGRRLDTEPLVERAAGRGLDAEPFLRHVGAG